jgi:2-phospho-L-lactate guanylyltransferase
MAHVVIGVRGGRDAKSRCEPPLAPAQRARLVEAMLEDMIEVVLRTPDVRRLWVVTPTRKLATLAEIQGARVIWQTGDSGLNAGFALAQAAIADQAPDEPLVLLPGDLPLLKSADLEAALALARKHDVVLAPAIADGGTGAVVMREGVRLPPSFGPDSLARHAAIADALGLSHTVVVATSLGLDLDRPADFPAVLTIGPCTRTARRLRTWLRDKRVAVSRSSR